MENNRIIGKYTSHKKGPLLIVTAGVHGNEPSGVQALEAVFKKLQNEKPVIKGMFVGILANTNALKRGVRFIDEDLNRTWTEKNLKYNISDTSEKQEMYQLIKVIDGLCETEYTNHYFMDCHTTSSDSLPYMSVQDVGQNLKWAQHFPLHIIKGFSDIVEGTIDGYFSKEGITGFTLEAGQHDSETSKIYHEGMIWMLLEKACNLQVNDLKPIPPAIEATVKSTDKQRTFKIIHRFGLNPKDDFKMQAGFENFQQIHKGQHLATLNGSEIYSTWDAFIFMPLYQAKGNDGFFVIESMPQ
ncbi:succinylglutamate desuccinylase [Formosa agariphila KMM 3901]|uniref:Succinylglutamate desuccinylase n=1 Tax=Formosa agariphila (strain DSM 15362 / KCTC 12365 / LMG 23005 / KMM 3901 / M-2Alg 35-1) TaxID=1347342 RepID=T2KIA6_FORAG|nr:succinylglutamate desuccinylase/aspartoacylase family protein [Formosa agariphila]CDF78163.1 succinylglutamate desuccinylase [Formosa agariphila KMM 3901]